MRLRMLITAAGLLVAAGWAARAAYSGDVGSKPLILEKNEGEHRVRRPRGTPIAGLPFIIKVDRKNGGSQQMWLGTEEIKPGAQIPRHQHLGQDEILILQTGTAHVWLGDQGAGRACRRYRLHPFRDVDQSKKHRQRTDPARVRLLRAGLRRLSTLQFDGRRRAVHADDARRSCRLRRKRARALRIAFADELAVSELFGSVDASAASTCRDARDAQQQARAL